MSKEIPLTQGQVAIVDDADYEELAHYKWRALKDSNGGRWYVRRTVFMHRQLVGAVYGQVVDHINHDGLDNRRANLRFCTPSQNQGNSRKQTGLSSRFKGVSWYKPSSRWQAYIMIKGKMKHLGYFLAEIDAARAYNEAAIEHFGEFAWLNAL